MTISKQFITDKKGNKISVVIPIKDYEKLMEYMEDLDDLVDYYEAKAANEPTIPARQAFAEIEKNRHDLSSTPLPESAEAIV